MVSYGIAGAPGRTVLRTDGVLLGKYDIINKVTRKHGQQFREGTPAHHGGFTGTFLDLKME